VKPLLRNALTVGGADAAARVAGFATTVYLARVLGPAAFGLAMIGASLLVYLSLMAGPGFPQVETRNTARPGWMTPARVDAILTLRTLLSLFLAVAWMIVLLLVSAPGDARTVILLYVLSLFPLALALDWWFQGKERFGDAGAYKVIGAVAYGLTAFFLVRGPGDVAFVPAAFFAGNAAAAAWLLLRYIGTEPLPRWRFSLPDARGILAGNAPVGLAVFLGGSVVSLPPILLGVAAGEAEAGIYSAAAKIVVVILLLDRLLNALLLPAFTRKLAGSSEDARELAGLALKVVLSVMLPLGVALTFAAPAVIRFVFGSAYLAGVDALRFLVWYCVVTLLNSLFTLLLVGSGRESEYTRAMVVGSAVAVCFVAAGAFLRGASGAAAGVVAGELVTATLMLRRCFPRLLDDVSAIAVRPLAGALLMTAAGAAAMVFGPVAAASAALAAYVIFALSGGLFEHRELARLREKIL
jgi:PST family polysaccharide transporter